MTIETKFDIGDEAYVLHENKVCKGNIDHISINVEENKKIHIYYKIFRIANKTIHGSVRVVFKEWQIFKTKEELLKSL